MNKRINLWASPRNVSTAIMYSFAQRADTAVIDEPFYASYLQSTGLVHPGNDLILASQSTQFDQVLSDVLFTSYQKPIVFFKQMSHHLLNADKSFLLDCENIILIREPKSMIRSFAKVISDPNLSDLGLAQSHAIFAYLKAHNKKAVVLDSGDLCQQPERMLKRLCSRLEIPYDEAMLSWPAGPRPEDGVWAPHWYANVHKSTGFSKQTNRVEELEARHLTLLNECLPLYLALQEEKISP